MQNSLAIAKQYEQDGKLQFITPYTITGVESMKGNLPKICLKHFTTAEQQYLIISGFFTI